MRKPLRLPHSRQGDDMRLRHHSPHLQSIHHHHGPSSISLEFRNAQSFTAFSVMDESRARRERLKALREAAELAENNGQDAEPPAEEPVLKFRNYVPRDEKIEHTKIEAAQPVAFQPSDPVPEERKGTGEEVVVDVAPKKANWDLKRDVAKKLAKLERRTQRALLEIMQDMEKKEFEDAGGVVD